jgi:hypothetical protein
MSKRLLRRYRRLYFFGASLPNKYRGAGKGGARSSSSKNRQLPQQQQSARGNEINTAKSQKRFCTCRSAILRIVNQKYPKYVSIEADRPGDWFAAPLGPYQTLLSGIYLSRDFERVSQVKLILSPKQRAKPKTSARKTGRNCRKTPCKVRFVLVFF